MSIQLEQVTSAKQHTVSLDEYDRMVEAGVFAPSTQIELIRGAIVDMTPPGQAHENCVTRLNLIFVRTVGNNALVWPQGNSIGLPRSHSRPQPDITLLKWREDLYEGKRPAPEDVLLIVEVSDSTLNYDRKDKLRLYAEAGIAEYWIANLVEGVIEVHTGLADGKYASTRRARRGERLDLPGNVGDPIAVDDILGRSRHGAR